MENNGALFAETTSEAGGRLFARARASRLAAQRLHVPPLYVQGARVVVRDGIGARMSHIRYLEATTRLSVVSVP